MIRTQSRAGKLVHRFAQPDVALAPELFGCRRYIVIEPDRRPHATNCTSMMLEDEHH
jgi:hypothetical protein